MQNMRGSHKEEIKKEKDRLEGRLRDQIETDLKFKLNEELELEFKDQLSQIKDKYQSEVEKVKQRYD